MGNYASKLLYYTNENQKECNESQTIAQQTIIEDNSKCTPELSEKRVLGDPRSISAGIARTPIEVKCTPVKIREGTPSAIPKYLQRKQYLETNMDVVIPPLTPKKCPMPRSMNSDHQLELVKDSLTPNTNIAKCSKIITPIDEERFIILGLDPRSPAADFDRTPILMPKSLALIKARSQENLYRRGSYETDIYNPKNSRQEIDTSLSIPEIQLLSDTVSESLKSSLDMMKQNELLNISQYDSNLSIFKNEKEITVIKNPKFISENKESLISDEQKIAIDNEDKVETKKQDNCENFESDTRMKDDDKVKLWHNSMLSEKSVSGKENQKALARKKTLREDVIITFDKYTTISTPLTPITKEDFRKKEDIKGKNMRNVKNRTPLGNRSNNDQIQKKPQQFFRGKAMSSRMHQENTPPCKTFNGKTKNGIQWDPNSTVLI